MEREAPKQFVVGINFRGVRTVGGCLLIGAGEHDQAMELLQAPAFFHEFACQPIEELRMGWPFAF